MTIKSLYNNFISSLSRYQSSEKSWIFIVLIAFAGAAIYFQTYNYNFTLDDTSFTLNNEAVGKGIKGVPDIFKYGSWYFFNQTNTGIYRPVTLLTFALEKQLSGEFNPAIGHTVNIILYFFILIITGLILIKLFHFKNLPVYIPLLILLLYAVHPLHVEVVASIKSRDTLLSAFFSFWAISVWLTNKNRLKYVSAINAGILFFLGLMSKEEGITLIAVVFFISYIFQKKNLNRSLKETVPFVLAAFIYLIIRSLVLDPSTETYDSVLNNVIYPLQGQERFATNLFIYLYYIKLLLLPFPLSWDYSFSQITAKTFSNGWVLLSFFFFLFLIYIAFKGLQKRTIFGFGILFYLSTFSIFSNFFKSINIGATLAERFMFIPSLGFSIVLVYGLFLLIKKINPGKIKPIILIIFIPVIACYSIKSFSRTKVWIDNITLYKSGLITAPNSWRVHNNIAEDYRLKALSVASGRDDNTHVDEDSVRNLLILAKSSYEKSLKILRNQKSKPTLNRINYAEVLLELKDTSNARVIYEEIFKSDPKIFSVCFKLGLITFYNKDFHSSVNYYLKALQANSVNFFPTYKNLGASYLMLKENHKAIEAYKKALEYGTSPDLIANLSWLYARVGDIEKAIEIKSKVENISEEEKHFLNLYNKGRAAYNKENWIEAISYYEQSNPDFDKFGGQARFPDFLNSWAHSLLQTNEVSKAKIIFDRVAEENPKDYFSLKNLGFIAFQHEKNFPKAIQYYSKSLDADSPDLFQSYMNLGTLYLIQNQNDLAIRNYENSLQHGTSETVIKNLYLLWKEKGDQEKVQLYESLMEGN